MARTKAKIEVSTFTGGLNTEASPLNFPPNASSDEKNFVLNKNGLRTRRLGFDLENNFIEYLTNVTKTDGVELATNFHKWTNAGGIPNKTIIVIQVGNEITFFDGAIVPLSSGGIFNYIYDGVELDQRISFADVDGMLVSVSGRRVIDVFVYKNGLITRQEKFLNVRDMFGVTDIGYINP
jgi:hypothetical protein